MPEKNDLLSRQFFVDNLIALVRQLADSNQGCTFAIDGQWGCGKSFVIDMFEQQLSLFESPDAAGDRYAIFHYNCWQYDYYDEPAIAIIAAIRNDLSKYQRLFPELTEPVKAVIEVAKDLGKDLIGSALETKFGINPFDFMQRQLDKTQKLREDEEKECAYDIYFNFKKALDDTRKQLASLAEDKPIVVVVDELDRCVPQYAIKVLERLHHLFDNQNNIIVVLAIDGHRLGCAIRTIYGIDEDAVPQYLKKFISFSINLDVGTLNAYFFERYQGYLSQFEGTEGERPQLNELIPQLFNGIDIRSQEKIMERIEVLHKLSVGNSKDVAILYFEILHQIMTYRCRSERVERWITGGRNTTYSDAEKELGKDLYDYIKELEAQIAPSTVVYMGDRNNAFYEIKGDPLSLAFWCMAALDEPIDGNTCKRYSLKLAEKYTEIVETAKRFNKLSKLIN